MVGRWLISSVQQPEPCQSVIATLHAHMPRRHSLQIAAAQLSRQITLNLHVVVWTSAEKLGIISHMTQRFSSKGFPSCHDVRWRSLASFDGLCEEFASQQTDDQSSVCFRSHISRLQAVSAHDQTYATLSAQSQ